ncbi:hypothetical protein WJX72_000748 [[Myrmecia] bisecta]|uniref:Luc7-like protein 3 n=1 Tax=[Myrmecia] bisecta TaxID=41462 RepID=A0AAW1R5J0_9CHLO
MVDAMRAMLDELMGKERDVPLEKRTNRGLKFTDREVCKYALAGLCPYGLFRNTKSDLGPCKYEVHEDDVQFDEVKAKWDELTEAEKERYGYDRELLTLLEQLCRDMDRKIERQRERAGKESAPRELTADDKSRLDALKAKQKEALDASERMAEGGDVDGSMLLAQQAEKFKEQHDSMLKQMTASERTMTVCDVCGVFINSTDNEQRRKDHLSGKQYLGWKAIRDKLEEMHNKYGRGGKLPGPPPVAERPRSRERSRERERHHSRDHKERDRDHKDRDRTSGRTEHRSKDRSRSRERHRRSGAEIGPPPSYRGGRDSDRRPVRERDRFYDDRRR